MAKADTLEIARGLWNLPNRWGWVALEELCIRIDGGGTPKRSHPEYFGGDIVWITPTDLDVNNPIQEVTISQTKITQQGYASSSAKMVPSGAVLFSSRASIGKIGIAGVPLCTNQGFANFVCGDALDNHYLAWCLRALTDEIVKLAGSTTYLEVSRGSLRRFRIPIPYPDVPTKSLNIQRRIVARVEALLAEVRWSRELVDEMHRDCNQVIATSLNEVIKNLDKEYPNSPTIEELIRNEKIKMEGGGTPSKSNASYWMGTIPWVSPKDMKSWYISDAQEHISDIALQGSSAKLIPTGSILTVVRGMILIHTFPVAVTQAEVTINQDMKALEPNDDFVPEYLGYILRARSPEILQKVEIAGHGTRRLKTETLNQVVIPFLDKNHQRRIVEYLNNIQSEINRMLELIDQDATTLGLLEQSILERAFRGEL